MTLSERLLILALELWRSWRAEGQSVAAARRLAAKRNNYRVTLLANSLNTVALTTFGAAFITPRIVSSPRGPYLDWIGVAFVLHSVAQSLSAFLQSEE